MARLLYPFKDAFLNSEKNFNHGTGKYENVLNLKYLLGAKIIAEDNTFLGNISDNRFNHDSILNKYGSFGSQYSQTSIFNNYGNYGSEYSQFSPFNSFTSTPPRLYKDEKFIAYLSTNEFVNPRIDTNQFMNWLKTI